MFCSRCGRQIDEDGKFCPFCGQKVGAPVNSVPTGSMQSDYQKAAGTSKVSAKKNRNIIWGLLAALTVVIVVVAAIVGVKLFGTKRTQGDQVKKSSLAEQEKSDDKDSAKELREQEEKEEGSEEAAGDTEKMDEDLEDTTAAHENPADGEILDVLTAYQRYVDELDDEAVRGCMLAYLDEDDIPELIVIGDYEAAGQMIVTCRDGELIENYIGRLGGLSYVEKQNFYRNSNGHMGYYYDEFYRLVDGEQTVIISGEYGDQYDDEGNLIWNEEDYPEQEYSWDGVSCSEEEYYDAIDKFVKNTVGDVEFRYVDCYGGDLYYNMLDAYEGMKYRKYSAYWPQIKEFELKDGVLTYTIGGGAAYGWGSNDDIMDTISCPVAPDCIWENRSVGMGEHYQPEVADTDYIQDTTYTQIKDWIDTEKQWFEEAAAEYGRDEVWVESPVNVVVVVKEGVVVRVYTVSS